jgi:hypothetical protein
MCRSGPENGGLVLRVDQKKWSVFKTDKQKWNKKWNDIKKNIIWMHASILKIQLFNILPKGGGGGGMCPLPPAHMSLIRKDSWTLTFCILIQFMHLLFLWLRTDHLTWRGGYGFFSKKKYSDSQCCWKKYSDFGGGKKNNLIQSFCHIT